MISLEPSWPTSCPTSFRRLLTKNTWLPIYNHEYHQQAVENQIDSKEWLPMLYKPTKLTNARLAKYDPWKDIPQHWRQWVNKHEKQSRFQRSNVPMLACSHKLPRQRPPHTKRMTLPSVRMSIRKCVRGWVRDKEVRMLQLPSPIPMHLLAPPQEISYIKWNMLKKTAEWLPPPMGQEDTVRPTCWLTGVLKNTENMIQWPTPRLQG